MPQKAQISGTEKRSLTSVCNLGQESIGSLLGPIPIALRNTETCHPNLANLLWHTPCQGLGVDNHNALLRKAVPTADQRPYSAMLPIAWYHTMLLQRCSTCIIDNGVSRLHTTRHHQ